MLLREAGLSRWKDEEFIMCQEILKNRKVTVSVLKNKGRLETCRLQFLWLFKRTGKGMRLFLYKTRASVQF